MTRYCACGLPLAQRPNEPAAAFAKRHHCSAAHRYRYFRPPPVTKNFGMERIKPQGRKGDQAGLLHYLYGRPTR
jgi:hypothetical protein